MMTSLLRPVVFALIVSTGSAADWTIETFAGTGVAGFSGDGGLATAAQVNNPSGVIRGPDGAIWFCETTGQRIRRVAPDGTINTIAGTGDRGDGPEGEPLRCAMNRLHGIFVAEDGSVFIGDSEAHRVRVLRRRP